ncbi:MAG: Gfo/Idh/MocA family oxidoreductase [Gemmatimonadota bacterium]
MKQRAEHQAALKRRDFLGILGAGAVPLAAGLISPDMASGTAPRGEAKARRSSRAVVRIGLIGAGTIVQSRHIPNFRRIPEVELVAVANSSLESSRRVTDSFGIAKPYANWMELLDDPEIDAVMIGTPPYAHSVITIAALEKGKHVLCQSRMANNAKEARDMLSASRGHPDLVCQLVVGGPQVALGRLLADGFLGELLSVSIHRRGADSTSDGFANYDAELDWRRDPDLNGFNIPLGMGSTYESMSGLLGRATRVLAMSKVHVPNKRAASGQLVSSVMPDHLDILYELASGAQIQMRISTTMGLSQGSQTWLYGTNGTIHVDGQRILAGRRGDTRLEEVPAAGAEGPARPPEEQFVQAIQGTAPPTQGTLEIGVHYMEFSEAVHRSARTGETVHLPLDTVD